MEYFTKKLTISSIKPKLEGYFRKIGLKYTWNLINNRLKHRKSSKYVLSRVTDENTRNDQKNINNWYF